MRLTVEAFGQKPIPMLTLDAGGRVDVVTMGGPALRARLDPRGCLVGPDGLWAELTRSGTLWTPHELLETERAAIRLPDGARLRIEPDGKVVRTERDGSVAPNTYGTLRLVGYRDEAPCAGLVLLGAFLAMMPSMAVVDGNPAMAPVPAESSCNEFRQAATEPEGDAGLGR
jgi:hypothetical protein